MKTHRLLISLLSISLWQFGLFAAGPDQNVVPEVVVSGSEQKSLPDSVSSEFELISELDELVIVEQKKLVTDDGATLVYNVTEDPSAPASNTLEILRKVPGVSVDAEDNVKVKGQSNFKILIDGREDPLLKGDLKTILKSLPASSIQKIEVISEPGAKYSAEGVSGILNLVTDRSRKLSGLLTSLRGWINASAVGGSLNFRTKLQKIMFDAGIYYNNGRVWPRSNINEFTVKSLDDSSTRLTESYNKSRYGWEYLGTNLNLSWEPDTLNLVTLSANFGTNPLQGTGYYRRIVYGPAMALLWSIDRRSETKRSNNSLGTQVSYQHSFGRSDHNLILSYQLYFGQSTVTSQYFNTISEGIVSEPPYSSLNTHNVSWSQIIQLDYSNRFSPRHLLEAGTKINLNNDGQNNRPFFGSNKEEAIVNSELAVNMNQLKDIYALYCAYAGTYGKFNLKVGLRYEHTRMGVRYRIGDYPDFITHLNDVVPNSALSYNLTDASSLRMAYQLRVSRPGIWSVNPYIDTLTPGQISYGNPNLKSEKSHDVSLTYSNYDHKFGFMTKVSYRFSNNALTDIIFMKDGLLNLTYENVGHSKSAILEFNCNWSITNNLRWNAYVSGYYVNLNAESELLKQSNAGWQTNFNIGIDWTLPRNFSMSAYGGFWTPWIDLQGRGEETGYYYGLGFAKSWLKDKALQLQLSAGNFLPAKRTGSYRQEDETVLLQSRYTYSQWNVGLSLSYSFGGLKSQVRKTAAVIERETSSQVTSKN